jgi:hypothetical protein
MNGVIYYNTGTVCLVRLLVSICSLRKFYAGPISILSWGDASHEICDRIATATDSKVIRVDFDMVSCKYPKYMAKTKLQEFTPYDNTLYLDSDTLVVGPVDELFNLIDQHHMLVTSIKRWTTRDVRISKRINTWAYLYPDLIEPALNFGHVINCGVYGFRRDASILNEWYKTAAAKDDSINPDEVSLQLLLPHHKHIVVDNRFNFITKRGDVNDPDIRILHYQARKHCHISPNNKWLVAYNEVAKHNVADVINWQPAGDPKLKKYLKLSYVS